MTPEELFNMFFEAQGVRRQHHFHRQQQRQQAGGEQQRGGLMSLAHFLPLILLFLFSFMSGPSTDQTVFSYVTRYPSPSSLLFVSVSHSHVLLIVNK
jgi:phosphopantetheinyl transferase